MVSTPSNNNKRLSGAGVGRAMVECGSSPRLLREIERKMFARERRFAMGGVIFLKGSFFLFLGDEH